MQDAGDAQSEVLTSLPAALASASEREVLRVAATSLASLYPGLGYIRVLLVSQNYHPSQLLELCSDQRMASVMAEACNLHSSVDSSASTASEAAHSLSHQAAMRQGVPIYTPLLPQQEQEQEQEQERAEARAPGFKDWQVLQQQFGLASFAAVPLMVAGTVHGVIMAASPTPHTFSASSMHPMRAVANMLAPYAAVLYKHSQIQAARGMLEQLLPPRVVAAAIGRLSMGGNSAADVFVPTHHDFQPEGGLREGP